MKASTAQAVGRAVGMHRGWPCSALLSRVLDKLAAAHGAVRTVKPDCKVSRRWVFPDGSSIALGPGGTWNGSHGPEIADWPR